MVERQKSAGFDKVERLKLAADIIVSPHLCYRAEDVRDELRDQWKLTQDELLRLKEWLEGEIPKLEPQKETYREQGRRLNQITESMRKRWRATLNPKPMKAEREGHEQTSEWERGDTVFRYYLHTRTYRSLQEYDDFNRQWMRMTEEQQFNAWVKATRYFEDINKLEGKTTDEKLDALPSLGRGRWKVIHYETYQQVRKEVDIPNHDAGQTLFAYQQLLKAVNLLFSPIES